MKRYVWTIGVIIAVALLAAVGCGRPGQSSVGQGLPADAAKVAQERQLTPDDVTAAVKTYTPTGKHDPYIMFASGGHSGQIVVIGVPSMRMLKVIGVFTPEPWQGYGYGGGQDKLIKGAGVGNHEIRWGDVHHPGISQTKGEYDGKFLFVNDKANARVAVVDLRDFTTKQIIKNPNALGDHGGCFVTPNTDWVIEGPQYATPIGWKYAPLKQYKEKYRGMITFWKFDRVAGRLDPARSFQIELPPYFQDLASAGKGPSDGWMFMNSFNTELATGGIEEGNPPFEAGTTKNDTDFLHIINWKKAAELVEGGKAQKINGMQVLSLQTAIKEGILFFAPEPKSPHGVDVTPKGEYAVVGGKLDPHVTIFSFAKIQEAIKKAASDKKDPYGVPILPLDDVKEAQVELGLGPLHTVFDEKGYAYTSLFLDSAVARWSLGGAYASGHPEAPWTLVQKLPVHYNIGHLTAVEGDTAAPGGKFLVALNKWSNDRFANVGPLLPQNLQLIDISATGSSMKLLYDMPIGNAEPHYAEIIKTERLAPYEIYPKVGWDAMTMKVDPTALTEPKQARIERKGKHVEIWTAVIRSHFTPEHVQVKQGDHVTWHFTNLERTRDATHGFALGGYNVNLSLEPGKAETIEFVADQSGTFPFYCTEFCSALHLEMLGYFLVEPSGATAATAPRARAH